MGAYITGVSGPKRPRVGVPWAAAVEPGEPAAARVDHRSFLLAFASVAVLLLFVGASEASRTLRAAPQSSDDERSPSPAGALTPLPTTGLAANEGTRP